MAKVTTFSCRIKEILSIRGMSQAELARITGISPSNISRYVKGDWEGKQDAVYKISKATDCSEAWLMGYDVPMERAEKSGLTIGSVLKRAAAERIKRARESSGLSIQSVADQLNVDCETIVKIENGDIFLGYGDSLLESLCELYKITPRDILDYDPESMPNDEEIKFALFGGYSGITDEMYEEVKRFAAFVKDREKKKG